MYPAEGAAVRRVLIPVCGALITGALLVRFFPEARGSGIPQNQVRALYWRWLYLSENWAFAEALEKEGRSEMAERNIRQVLDRDSNDGEANLEMARLSAGAKPEDATAFYYRGCGRMKSTGEAKLCSKRSVWGETSRCR